MAALRTEIWAAALIRRAQAGGAFAAVLARGDGDGGEVIVKVAMLNGRARVFAPAPGMGGERRWIEPLGGADGAEEREVDAFLARRREFDPDLWIIEIEDRRGRNFLDV